MPLLEFWLLRWISGTGDAIRVEVSPPRARRCGAEDQRRSPCPSQALHLAPTPPTCSPCTVSSGTASGPHPRWSGALRPTTTERVELIANYYENILSFLEAHHDGEEHLVFRCCGSVCDGAGRVDGPDGQQHHEALALLEGGQSRIGPLWARPVTPRRSRPPGAAGRAVRAPGRASCRGGAERAAAGGGEYLSMEEWAPCPDTAWPNFHGGQESG